MPPLGAIQDRPASQSSGIALWNRQSFSKPSRYLGWLILCLGIYAASHMAVLVRHSFSPIIEFDQWEVVNSVMQSNGHLSPAQLWAQHNEHRIPFGRLACYADLRWFGGRNVSLLIENYLIQALASLLFAFMLRRFGNLSRPAYLTVTGFAVFCFFSPGQIDNFVQGFQITFLLCLFTACLAFAAMILHAYSELGGKVHSFSGPLLVSLASAAVSEFSLSSGLLVWPILIALSFALKLAGRAKLATGITAGFATSAYFWRYQFPHHETGPLFGLRHPLEVAKYVIHYLAAPWTNARLQTAWPTYWVDEIGKSNWPTINNSLTVLALALIALGLGRFLIGSSKDRRLNFFLYANILFVIGTATLTALGRLQSGLAQASSTRYQSVSLIFWVSFAALAVQWVDARRHSAKLIAAQVLILAALVNSVSHFATYRHIARARQAALRNAYASLARDPSDEQALRALYLAPALVPRWYQYLRANGWGPRDADLGFSTGWTDLSCPSALCQHSVQGYTLASPARCEGVFDALTVVPGGHGLLIARGWAWEPEWASPPRKVLVVLSTGEVLAQTSTGLSRPDVPVNVPGVTGKNTGWRLKFQAPEHGTFRAFAVLHDSQSVCPLSNQVNR